MIIGGFVLLIKGADFLVSGASSLAKKFKISDLAIGLTIVAMGTSAPELLVNILSGSQNKTGLVFGNIIGSNIFNLFLILGIASIIFPMSVRRSVLVKDVPYCIAGLVLLLVLANDSWFFGGPDGLSRLDCIILLSVFVLFLGHTFVNLRKGTEVDLEDEDIVTYSASKSIIFIVLGIVGLSFGGEFVVEGAIDIATMFKVDEKIIGLTILAGGTSLPELATSVVAAFNRKSDLAVGNIVGSNIFNTLMVLSVTGLLTSDKGGVLSYDADPLNTDMYITLGGMFMLVAFMFTLRRRKIDRAEGVVLLIGFIAYFCLIYTRL